MSEQFREIHPFSYRVHESEGSGESQEIQIYLRPGATLLRVHDSPWHPPTDIFETPDHHIIKVELAGVSHEDIQVRIDEGSLFISGKRSDQDEGKIIFRRMEIKYGSFEINMRLPTNIVPSRIEACYTNGFLLVKIPKKNDSQSTARMVIEVD